ncbi:tetratricopeptide repeat protein [Nocardia sp. NPDC051832]|uniref:tetratricopeptide repeat protein n=1 Tax=Nocardia sp. NPDC051832 TaxID=3155673 RepID=UPI00341B3565
MKFAHIDRTTAGSINLTYTTNVQQLPAPARDGRIVVGEIPQEPRHFVERAEARELGEAVARSRIVVVVTGMRGTGKTHLAAALARSEITTGAGLVGWINAATIDAARTGLAEIAQLMGLAAPEEDSTVAAQRLRGHLSSERRRGLLIFDNATDPDEIRALLPATGETRVVITTTDLSFTALGEPVDLGCFTEREAIDYLCDSTGLTDQAGARQLAGELGRLPLALTAAATTIAARRLDFDRYLTLLRAKQLPHVLARKVGQDYKWSVAQAILLSVDSVEAETADPELDAATRNLIALMAMLSPAGVRRAVLPDLGGRLDDVIDRCVDGSLLAWSDSDDALLMHRLVSRVLRERAESNGEADDLVMGSLGMIAPLMSTIEGNWTTRELFFHIADQIDAIGSTDIWERGATDTAELMLILRKWATQELCDFADLVRSETLGRSTLADCERILGPEHPTTLAVRVTLANSHTTAGRVDEAIDLLESSLEIYARVLGPDDPETLTARNNLAAVYHAAGRHDRAVTLHEATLADRERVLGPDHPDTLDSRNNLADSYSEVGQLTKAIALHEANVADRERVLGPDHPDTLSSRGHVAYAYVSIGQLDKAIALHQAILRDRERLRGPDHPDTLTSRNNLATTYQTAGRLDLAIDLHEATTSEFERLLGPDHPNTLTSRNNQASAYAAAGQLDKAIALHDATLTDRERILGPDHPDTLGARHNLANTYESAGQTATAVTLHETNLARCEQLLGPDHPITLTSRAGLADSYTSAGQIDKAIALDETNLADVERVLGPEHPYTFAARNNLATAYTSAGHIDKAITLYETNLADVERVLGPDHPDTFNSRGNLAALYESAGQPDLAIALQEANLADVERVLGPDHPHTLHARNNLAYTCRSVGLIDRALDLYARNLTERERVFGPAHPDTLISRNNLAAVYAISGAFVKSIALHRENLGLCERVLGADHPVTINARDNIPPGLRQ